jgi:hypothetical protein
MMEGLTYIATAEFARCGLTIHLGTKELHRVSSTNDSEPVSDQ